MKNIGTKMVYIFTVIFLLTITGCYSEDELNNLMKNDAEEKNVELLIEIENGVSSLVGIENKRLEVIRDESSYEALFRRANDFSEPPKLGEIDFDRYQVIAAFRGFQGNNGNLINIISVIEKDRYYEVTIENIVSCIHSYAETHPYSFKMIPVGKEVIFREIFVVEECSEFM